MKLKTKKSFEEKVSKNISKYIFRNVECSPIEQAQIEYGLSVILVNVIKVLIIYILALLIGIFPFTFITHFTFVLMRRNCYGYHSKSSLLCTLLGVLYFVIVPYILVNFIEQPNIFISFVLLSFINTNVFVLAPSFTSKSYRVEKQQKKIKAVAISILLSIMILALNRYYFTWMMLFGMLLTISLMYVQMSINFNLNRRNKIEKV